MRGMVFSSFCGNQGVENRVAPRCGTRVSMYSTLLSVLNLFGIHVYTLHVHPCILGSARREAASRHAGRFVGDDFSCFCCCGVISMLTTLAREFFFLLTESFLRATRFFLFSCVPIGLQGANYTSDFARMPSCLRMAASKNDFGCCALVRCAIH